MWHKSEIGTHWKEDQNVKLYESVKRVEVYSESKKAFKMELFTKIINDFEPLTFS